MSRPSLLFLCHITPFPPDGGAEIRAYHLLKLLVQEFDVTALCLGRLGESASTTSDRCLQLAAATGASVRAFPRARMGTLGAATAHLAALLTRRVYTTRTVRSDRLLRELKELGVNRFQVVHVDSLDLSSCLPLLPLSKVVCGHHNVESSLLRRRGAAQTSPLARRYFRLQANLMAREERRWCGDVALNLTVSEGDRRDLLEIVPRSRVAVVPNGVNVDRILPGNAQASGIVFIGGASWFPNRDALAYFAREILPQIRQQSDASVTWVGNADAAARAVGEAAGIQMTGFVPDILPYLHAATCFIAPLRVGGGTRLKILDAWAAGLPVVSTPIGCEGLNAVDGLNILIREDPTAFADAVLKVLRDSALQSALGSAARATAEADYSWDVIGQRMLPLYRAVAEGRAL